MGIVRQLANQKAGDTFRRFPFGTPRRRGAFLLCSKFAEPIKPKVSGKDLCLWEVPWGKAEVTRKFFLCIIHFFCSLASGELDLGLLGFFHLFGTSPQSLLPNTLFYCK